MDTAALRARIEEHVRRHDLIAPGGEVTCLVSGGADSTCLWHALGALGYRVSALHVNHGLRGEESEADARFCAERLGAEVVEAPPAGRATEAELRDLRYAVGAGPPARDRPHGLRPGGDDPLPARHERDDERDPRAAGRRRRAPAPHGLARGDARRTAAPRASRSASTPPTRTRARGLIRAEILPALRQLHPAAERNVLAALEERRTAPATGRESAVRVARLS